MGASAQPIPMPATGATGHAGSALVDRLTHHGAPVRAMAKGVASWTSAFAAKCSLSLEAPRLGLRSRPQPDRRGAKVLVSSRRQDAVERAVTDLRGSEAAIRIAADNADREAAERLIGSARSGSVGWMVS
jgi:nucleoside-diphosphate-sugar epimerase